MWIAFGFGAILTAILNVILTLTHQETKWFRFISLSLTALTLCAFYSQTAQWVLLEDWSAMIDVVPALSKLLWFLTGASVLLNSISLFGKKK